MSRRVTVAAAQYPVGELKDWEDFATKLTRWCREGAAGGAQLLVFPEYASMELASLFEAPLRADLHGQIAAMQTLLPRWQALHRDLARQCGVFILGGSFPVRMDDGRYHNRAHLFSPAGEIAWQDKRMMTRFENEQWGIASGEMPLQLFDTAIGRIGVCICYDVEFPLIARALAEAGAEILLAPSCTDTLAGYHRVRIGARARALENQCYVVQAPLIGEAPWSPAVDVNVGIAGVFTPVDRGFPDDGVIAEGQSGAAGWTFAALDLAGLDRVRVEGQVFNHRDWPKQVAPTPGKPRVVAL